MKIKILYEDANILAIDKPSGIAVHGDGRSKEKTIADWVLKKYPKMKNVGELTKEVWRPGIVHRLDRDTSGVLLLAKNQKTYEFLKQQFQSRTIKKIYNAIVSGSVKNERGVIAKPIGRSPKDFRRYSAGRGARGEMQEAITRYKVAARFEDKKGNKFTYLEIYPKTGRTHQIRVHMKYLNHPVVGDELYNPGAPVPPGISRMALHALSIEFNLPAGKAGDPKGNSKKIQAPLPPEFKKVIK